MGAGYGKDLQGYDIVFDAADIDDVLLPKVSSFCLSFFFWPSLSLDKYIVGTSLTILQLFSSVQGMANTCIASSSKEIAS